MNNCSAIWWWEQVAFWLDKNIAPDAFLHNQKTGNPNKFKKPFGAWKSKDINRIVRKVIKNIKEIIRISKLKDRQCNGTNKKLQSIAQKTNDLATWTSLVQWVNSCVLGDLAVPAPMWHPSCYCQTTRTLSDLKIIVLDTILCQ